MKFTNYAKGQNYKVAVQLSMHDFNHNYQSLYLQRFVDKTQFVVFAYDTESSIAGKAHVLGKFPKGTLLVLSDVNLWKHCTKQRTLPKLEGNILTVDGYHYQYMPYSQKALYMQKPLQALQACVEAVQHFLMTGSNQPIVKRKGFYPSNAKEVIKAFKYLFKQPALGVDIEATSLKFYKANLVSIAFAPDEKHGVTFHVKKCEFESLLVKFFKQYKGKLVWHGGSYDIKALAYMYFNGDSRELFRTYEDTSIIHYICTNSPERFPRDLGTLGAPLCGEYKLSKKEITDMMNVDVQKVCEYNLDDARATIWLYSHWRPRIHSEYLYEKFKQWQWCLVQTELAGMPFNYERKQEVEKEINTTVTDAMSKLLAIPAVRETAYILRTQQVEKYNSEHIKQKTEDDFELQFNPNSSNQLAVLFYDVLDFKCTEYTATKKRSASSKTLDKLRNQCLGRSDEKECEQIFDYIDKLAKASKIQSTFLPALDKHHHVRDGNYFLHGTFNLAKVVSGRLSSSKPNLTNLPSGSVYGKLFKSIFQAPKGWCYGGADFASLEDRINAILTNDKNKVKVYTDGYDGHSLRAFNFFKDLLPDIEDTVESINSIQDKYADIRTRSKRPTFSLTYDGTWVTLHKDAGFTVEEAKRIEKAWHDMYSEADAYVKARMLEAADKGYLEVAFGLRIYCYGLTRALLNSKNTPYLIQKQIKTLGNAIGQSYGMLNTDAATKFLLRVYDAGLQNDVLLTGQVHDAIYPMWRDKPEITAWVNNNLVECMADISEHPVLKHEIKLGANLDWFVESWAKHVTLPSHIEPEEVESYRTKYFADKDKK